jgi:hypothetical protein
MGNVRGEIMAGSCLGGRRTLGDDLLIKDFERRHATPG